MPEADYDVVRHIRGVTLPPGTVLHRGHRLPHHPSSLVPGLGDTRFAPLDGVHHVYAASNPVAAALESLLHEAWGPAPRIHEARLGRWAISQIELTSSVRLADLRNPELARLGVPRDGLVSTSAQHYRCTRQWARQLAGRAIGGHTIVGAIWASRQQELRAAASAARPALSSLIGTGEADVAVLWAPPAARDIIRATGEGLGPLDVGPGAAFVEDLADLLDITIV